MAYDSNQLSAMTYANGFTLWHYRTADSFEEVAADNYFEGAAGMLREGDFLFLYVGADSEESASMVGICVENKQGRIVVGGILDQMAERVFVLARASIAFSDWIEALDARVKRLEELDSE